ncbi:MAG: radical SAM protein [Armatimonadetes bacterium]|nr:radical SAM protein [Armatimonadota bacterium]
MPEKTLAPHLFMDLTRSLCPVCRRVVDAQVQARDSKVILRKRCPEHGPSEALLSSDLSWYLHAMRYNRPGLLPGARGTEARDGCPYDCGLCPEHQQHTCLAIIEVNHPQISEILAAVRRRPVRYVMLNTNGLRLARDDEFVRRLADLGVYIYLQFDGLESRTHLALRGVDLRREKQEALDRLARHGVQAVLAATVVKGINDHEIGAIVRFGLEHPAVRGVAFQPVFLEGRHVPSDPLDRMTVPDVLCAIEAQSGGLFTRQDFTPVPCCHPTCMAMCYAYVENGTVTPLARIVDVDAYLDYFVNRALPDVDLGVRKALEGLLSAGSVGGSEKQILNFCAACGLQLPGDLRNLVDRIFMINVTGFMDVHTFEVRRVMKCCIHELLPDGRLVPFCAYNTIGYREQVLHDLTAHR